MDRLNSVHDEGFAIIPRVFTSSDFEPLNAAISEPSLQRSRAGIRHAMKLNCVRSLVWDERLLGMAKQLLGDGAFPFKATIFDKSDTANWLVAWHQDTALPLKQKRETPGWGPWSVKDGFIYARAPVDALGKIIALRVHLDDSGLENGPLRVLPRTHVLGVLDEATNHELGRKILAVDCIVPTGGVLAMRPLLVHASSKSQSNAPRRVLHIEYAETPVMGNGLELAEA